MPVVAALIAITASTMTSNQPMNPMPSTNADPEHYDQHRDDPWEAKDECAEDGNADHSLRHPIGPGVNPLDRLVHRRNLDPPPNQSRLGPD